MDFRDQGGLNQVAGGWWGGHRIKTDIETLDQLVKDFMATIDAKIAHKADVEQVGLQMVITASSSTTCTSITVLTYLHLYMWAVE